MSPRGDEKSVQTARDEAVIAGRALTSDDAALAELVTGLRASTELPAPAPSPALQATLTAGLGAAAAATRTEAEAEVVDLAAARARRALRAQGAARRWRVARYAVGAGMAATLALGGTAAVAAVREGVPLTEVPGEIGRQIGRTVQDALEAVGLRHGTEPTFEPTRGMTPSGEPRPSGGSSPSGVPGGGSDPSGSTPGRAGDTPVDPRATGGPDGDPARPADVPAPTDQAPGSGATSGEGRTGSLGDTPASPGGVTGGSTAHQPGSDPTPSTAPGAAVAAGP